MRLRLAIATVALAAGLGATPLTTGNVILLPFLSNFNADSAATLGVLQAGATVPLSTSLWAGSLTYGVYRNGGGTLDFYYQFHSNAGSFDDIQRLTFSNYSGFAVDAGYRSNAFGAFIVGNQAPASMDRNSPSTIGANFPLGLGEINATETSYTIVLKTSAVNYTIGNTGVIDGITTNTPTPQPATVPEPATLAATGAGLIALGFARRRR